MRKLTTHLNRRFFRLLPVVLIIILILGIIGPNTVSAASGWYDLNWLYSKKITFHAANITATMTDFPVLISLGANSDLAIKAQDDGDDILFMAADNVTKLSHEIEYFNGTTGNLTAWVKIPSLSSVTDTVIYMYYGNAGASNQQDRTNVWDSNYKMVQHLEETFGGPSVITDSTSNSNNGTDQNSPTFGAIGKIDGAITFTGTSNQYINCGNAASLDITDNLTLEAWIYPTISQSSRGIVAKAQTGNLQYILYLGSGGAATFGIFDGFSWSLATGSVPTVGAWSHIVGVYDGTNVNVYVNKTLTVGAAFSGSFQSTTAAVTIANYLGLTTTNAFTGTIDEVRISNSARSADWINNSYNNQSNPASIFSIGLEQNAPTAPTVTTNAATLVEEETATLNGYLDADGGEACEYAFEWGTASGVYTANISWTGSINTGASFSTNLVGLIKGQPYYYRAMAKNSVGVTYGSEEHFLTKPDGPTGLTATANSSSRIDLSWTKAASAQRTMVRRATGTYPATYTDGVEVYFDTGSSFSDTGLSPSTNYFYRAWSEVTGSQQFSNTFSSTNMTTLAGAPGVIGGKVFSVNKAAILVPWITIGVVAALALASGIYYVRRKMRSRPPSGQNHG